jgi:hypothetical protein
MARHIQKLPPADLEGLTNNKKTNLPNTPGRTKRSRVPSKSDDPGTVGLWDASAHKYMVTFSDGSALPLGLVEIMRRIPRELYTKMSLTLLIDEIPRNATVMECLDNGTFNVNVNSNTQKSGTTPFNINAEEFNEGLARRQRDSLHIVAINPSGQLELMTCSPCAPVADPDGKTPEERGATRYLGVYLSFTGWEEQIRQTKSMYATFFRRVRQISPTFRELKALINSLLASKLHYARQVLPIDMAIETDLLYHLCKATSRSLKLCSSGPSGRTWALMGLRPEHGLGMGMPDPEDGGLRQDCKRLVEALVTPNDQLAASFWVAVEDGLTTEGTVTTDRSIPPSEIYSTVFNRMRNLLSVGVTVHLHDDDNRAIPLPLGEAGKQVPLPPLDIPEHNLLPSELATFGHDITIAKLPSHFFFAPIINIPDNVPDVLPYKCDASRDFFAAIMMAIQTKSDYIAVIDSQHPSFIEIDDPLVQFGSTDEERIKKVAENGGATQAERHKAMKQLVILTMNCKLIVEPESLLRVKLKPATLGSPEYPSSMYTVFDVSRIKWIDGEIPDAADLNPEQGPNDHQDPPMYATRVRNKLHADSYKVLADFIEPLLLQYVRNNPKRLLWDNEFDASIRWVVVSDASDSKKIPASKRPSFQDKEKYFLEARRSHTKHTTHPPLDDLKQNARLKEIAFVKEQIEKKESAYIWVLYARGVTERDPTSGRLTQGGKPQWRLCRVENSTAPGKPIKWSALASSLHNQHDIRPNTAEQNPRMAHVPLDDLKNEHSEGYIKGKLQYDDVDTDKFYNELCWVLAYKNPTQEKILRMVEAPPTPNDVLSTILNGLALADEFLELCPEREWPILREKLELDKFGIDNGDVLQWVKKVKSLAKVDDTPTTATLVSQKPEIIRRDVFVFTESILAIDRSYTALGRFNDDSKLTCSCIYCNKLALTTAITTTAAAKTNPIRPSRREACEKDSHFGLQPFNGIDVPLWSEHCGNPRKTDEEPDDSVHCICGKYFPTQFRRDMHIASTRDSRCHGPTPDELHRLGGAYIIVDRVTGETMYCNAFRIPNIGLGEDNSTIAEAAASCQGIRRAAVIIKGFVPPPAESHRPTGLIIASDNQAVMNSFTTHLTKFSTIPRMLKVKFLGSLLSTFESAQHLVAHGASIVFKWVRNEHGRHWSSERHGVLCKLNRCCDHAAGIAAVFDGQIIGANPESPPPPKSGNSVFDERSSSRGNLVVAINRLNTTDNCTDTMIASANLMRANFVHNDTGEQGTTIRQLARGEVDKAATIISRKQMSSEVEEAAMRALMWRSPLSMGEMRALASKTSSGQSAKALFTAAGSSGEDCPFCSHLPDGPRQDSWEHIRFRCKDPVMVTARLQWLKNLNERLKGCGRVGSGDLRGRFSCSIFPAYVENRSPWKHVTWISKDDSTDAKLASIHIHVGNTEGKRMNVSGIRLHTLANETLKRAAVAPLAPSPATSFAGPVVSPITRTLQGASIRG